MPTKLFTFFSIVLITALAGFQPQAAPQILGLVASLKPVPMTCAIGVCSAEITSICLQEHRRSPDSGTAYKPAAGSILNLVMVAGDGSKKTLPVADKVSIKSLRGFMSVAISVPEATVRRLGTGEAALTIGPLASAIPVTAAGGSDPLKLSEIAYTIGPLRALAEMSFERNGAAVNATRYLTQMMNRLPDDDTAGTRKLNQVWREVAGPQAAKTSPGATDVTEKAIADCRYKMQYGVDPSYRACLASHRDILAATVTQKYWKLLKPGG